MEVRPYKKEDYEQIARWWLKHGWTPLNPKVLPETGYIVDGYACCFLYKTDSSVCWMAWPVTNPDTDKELRSQAINLVIDALKQKSIELGYESIITTTNLSFLQDRYKSLGFVEGDINVNQYIFRSK